MDELSLVNYIGLLNCNQGTPESELYINDLPGMSTELADNIANSELINFAGVWAKVQKRSLLRLKSDAIMALYDYIKFNQVVYQTRRLLKSQVNQLVPIERSPIYAGVYLMVPETKYAEFRFDEIYIYSSEAVSTTLNVWDVNDGTILYTQSVTLVVGLNIIPVKQVFYLKYRLLELFIGIDTTNFDSIQTLNDYYYWYTSDWACAAQSAFGYGAVRGVFQLFPSTFNPNLIMNFENIDRQGLGQGIAIGGEVRCSIDQFLYDNREILKQSLLYLLGAEMLLEKNNSARLNYFTASNLEQTENTRGIFEKRYIDTLKTALNSIPLTGENVCFSCEETFKVATKSMVL